MQVKHIKHNSINYLKWDRTISESINSLIYAESWYLDIVSPGWEALISGDYEYVMPLPLKRKWGIPFLVQPPLTQQLGLFSAKEIDQDIIDSFIQKIPYFSYHINLNEKNKCSIAKSLPNYLLCLNGIYKEIESNYSKNTKRNISKALKSGIVIKEDIHVNQFLNFYFSVEKNYKDIDKVKMINFINSVYKRDKLKLYGAFNESGNLVSTLAMLMSRKRLIYLLPVSNEIGKTTSAMFLIIDSIIHYYCSADVSFDFAGSKKEGIARFYKGFGGRENPYFELKKRSVVDFVERIIG